MRHFLSKPGARVLWVNPYISRLLNIHDIRQSMALHDQRTSLPDRLEVQTPFALPVEPLPGGTALNATLFWRKLRKEWERFAASGSLLIGIGKPSRLALSALRAFPNARSFYDVMDNFPTFHQGLSRRAMEQSEKKVLSLVDEVFASSGFLVERMRERHDHVKKVLNAYDMQKLPPLRKPGCKPAGESATTNEKFLFGYVGSIAAWFDWDVVFRIADAFPGHPIHLVGPRFVPVPARLPEQVKLFGPCNQEEALAHAERFTVGLIPFKQTLLTAGVDPIKYYEYRGLGLPVLSTRFGEMAERSERDGVFIIENGEEVGDVVEKALKWRNEANNDFRIENDWTHRLERSGVFEDI